MFRAAVTCPVLILMLAQLGMAGNANATPGCMGVVDSGVIAQKCQWSFNNPRGFLGGGDSGNAYGLSLYHGMEAPPPSQSAGIRQSGGVTSVMYNNYKNDCRFVDNRGNADLFVPQNSAKEFEDFVNSFLTSAAPTVLFGYCTQGIAYTYTAKASMPNNFSIFGVGADNGEVDPEPSTYALSPSVRINVPPMRVPAPFIYPVPATLHLSLAPALSTSVSYFREDCRIDAAKATVCNQRPITETQVLTFSNSANPNPTCSGVTVGGVGYGTGRIDSITNCDGQWLTPTVVSTYTVGNDPTQWGDPYEDYLPPE